MLMNLVKPHTEGLHRIARFRVDFRFPLSTFPSAWDPVKPRTAAVKMVSLFTHELLGQCLGNS